MHCALDVEELYGYVMSCVACIGSKYHGMEIFYLSRIAVVSSGDRENVLYRE